MKPTILIVDDEPGGRRVIESVLVNQGYQLEFASTGREALEKATVLKPDLILLDLMLPEMDGMEVCQHIRRSPGLAEVPVVMVTALDDRNTRIACLDAGADDFISKPFDRAELRARVRTITRLNRYRLLHERDLITSWIAEKSSDGYLQVHTDDRILFANSRACFYLGLDAQPNQPIEARFMDVVLRQYTPHPEPAWEGWPVLTMSAAQNRYLVRPESDTAHEFWLEVALFENPGTEGAPRARIIRLRDVTADILNRRNTRSFGEAIAHKIRTPVTHIVSSLDLLARMAPQMSQDEITQFAKTALHGARRLHESLDRVLKYSNLSTRPEDAVGCTVDELTQLVEKVSLDVGIRPARVRIEPKAEDARLTLSIQSLEVLLWELMENSKKFHPSSEPEVTVDIMQSTSQTIAIRVSDNGMALSPKQLAEAWRPYYQGEKDFTGEAPGMGLGLSTVSTIVWGAGGQCHIMNRNDGPGVTVELVLPEARLEEPVALEARLS